MYRIDILDKDFNALTTIWQQSIYNFSYTNELNKPGSARFTLKLRDAKATTTNLNLYNRVKISRAGVGVFLGYIDNLRASLNDIEVFCMGMLGLFKKRIITTNITATAANTAVASILSTINSLDDTGISIGTNTPTDTINDVQLVRSKVLAAWDKIANLASQAEFEIDTNRKLNFVTQLGTNKTSTVKFQYNINAINTSTIFDFDVEFEGKDIFNAVTGIRNGGTTTIKTDATSIAAFGRLEEAKNFSQTANDTDLANETQNYVDNRKDEFYSPKITVNTKKIAITAFEVGDTIKIILNNGFINLNRNDRIIKKEVRLSSNNTEEVDVELIPTGSNLLPSTFQNVIVDIAERVNLLESTI
jgi:hypothetical protein